MEEKELWMNKLKEKLGDYSEPLPASGWEQLEKNLCLLWRGRYILIVNGWWSLRLSFYWLWGHPVSLYFLGTPAADHIRNAQTPALASMPDALPGVQRPDAGLFRGTCIETGGS